MPCFLKTPASLAPIQFNMNTLFWGMTTSTFSKACAIAGAPETTDVSTARQANTDFRFNFRLPVFAVGDFIVVAFFAVKLNSSFVTIS